MPMKKWELSRVTAQFLGTCGFRWRYHKQGSIQQKTIQENGSRVKYLYQHDMDKPIGKMVHLEEDEKGLVFEAQVPKTRLGM